MLGVVRLLSVLKAVLADAFLVPLLGLLKGSCLCAPVTTN